MLYADYEYYISNYKGTLSADSFDTQIVKASRLIDKNVNTRLTEDIINNLPEEAQDQLKYTACALTDLICKKETSDNKSVASISIDGVSKNFKTLSKEEYSSQTQEIITCLPDELTRYL